MQVFIKKIPHKWQRYSTVGDYYEEFDGRAKILISKMPDPRWELLITFHEFGEYLLIKNRGIKISDIDAFDMNFENERERGKHSKKAEPGNSKKAPYHLDHKFMTKCEKLLAKHLGMTKKDWKKYEAHIASIS